MSSLAVPPAQATSAAAELSRWSRAAVWLVTALQAMLMLGMMVLYPPFQSPDEVSHVDYVLAHRHGEWLDAPGQRQYQSGVLAAFASVPNTQAQVHVGGVPPVPRDERRSFDALGTTPAQNGFPNQMVQHPPLYYGLAAGFSYLLPDFAQHRFDVQVFWLRLFSLLLLLPVPTLIYSTARHVTRRTDVALVAMILPLSMPSYLRTGSSVTNDSLLVLLLTVTGALTARIAWGDRSRRTAVLLGVAWGAALLTKGFALALPPAFAMAYLVGARGSLRQRLTAAWPGLLTVGVVGSAIGAWWWIRNLVLFGTVQPDGLGPMSEQLQKLVYGAGRPASGELVFFVDFFGLLLRRLWGSLGMIDTPSLPLVLLLPLAVVFTLALVASVVVGLPALSARRQQAGLATWTAARAMTMLAPTLLILLVVYQGSRSTYLRSGELAGVQVRYFVPTIIGMAICAAVVAHVVAGRFARWLPLVTLSLGLAFVALSVAQVLRVEMSSAAPDRFQRWKDALRFVVGWAPFPAPVTGLVFVTAVLVAVAAIFAGWRQATTDHTASGELDDSVTVSAEARID